MSEKVWVKTENGGYWVKENKRANFNKMPLFCPYEDCRRITGTVDDKYLREYGVCYTCFTKYIDAREKPVIDVEFYKNRLKERGF